MIEWCEHPRSRVGEHSEKCGEQCEKAGENEAEAALGGNLNDLFPGLELVRAKILVFHPVSSMQGTPIDCASYTAQFSNNSNGLWFRYSLRRTSQTRKSLPTECRAELEVSAGSLK